MIVGVPRETYPGERRVALAPAVIPSLKKAGLDVLVQAGAGLQAGYPDAEYVEKGRGSLQPARKSLAPPTFWCNSCVMAPTTRTEAKTFRCSAKAKCSWALCDLWEH